MEAMFSSMDSALFPIRRLVSHEVISLFPAWVSFLTCRLAAYCCSRVPVAFALREIPVDQVCVGRGFREAAVGLK